MRPAQVEITEGQQMCAICSDVGNGVHFGVITCEGCKVRLFELLLLEDELIATRMWANGQRDGCPAKHRWHPLFNAAKFG